MRGGAIYCFPFSEVTAKGSRDSGLITFALSGDTVICSIGSMAFLAEFVSCLSGVHFCFLELIKVRER